MSAFSGIGGRSSVTAGGLLFGYALSIGVHIGLHNSRQTYVCQCVAVLVKNPANRRKLAENQGTKKAPKGPCLSLPRKCSTNELRGQIPLFYWDRRVVLTARCTRRTTQLRFRYCASVCARQPPPPQVPLADRSSDGLTSGHERNSQNCWMVPRSHKWRDALVGWHQVDKVSVHPAPHEPHSASDPVSHNVWAVDTGVDHCVDCELAGQSVHHQVTKESAAPLKPRGAALYIIGSSHNSLRLPDLREPHTLHARSSGRLLLHSGDVFRVKTCPEAANKHRIHRHQQSVVLCFEPGHVRLIRFQTNPDTLTRR